MKLVKILMIAVAALALSLAACGNKGGAPAPEPGYVEYGK